MWTLDEERFGLAKTSLGIVLPVTVRKTTGRQRLGSYRLCRGWEGKVRAAFCHKITISRDLSPEEASRTLWHELCHAQQASRDMRQSGRRISTLRAAQAHWRADEAVRRVAYASRSCEIEATQFEQRAEQSPLCF